MAHTTLNAAADGSVTIPAAAIAELGIAPGDRLLVRVVDEAVVLERIDHAIRRVRTVVSAYFASYAAGMTEAGAGQPSDGSQPD